MIGFDVRGGGLATLQALQIGIGLVGQVILLTRWSPDTQTDLFLLFSGVPWLVSGALLISGLDMAFPAAYHRALQDGGDSQAHWLSGQVMSLSLVVGAIAALISGLWVVGLSTYAGLAPELSLWMGVALGSQVVPATLAGFWRGLLLAREQLIPMQLSLLAGSLVTVAGYAVLPGPPALALPLVAALAVVTSAILAGCFSRTPQRKQRLQPPEPLHPEIRKLARSLVALGCAAALVHLQTIIEQAALLTLGAGMVTAYSVATRGWNAVISISVAASVMPVYPRWASGYARSQDEQARVFLRWSLSRAVTLSLIAASVAGPAAWLAALWLEHNTGWRAGAQAVRSILALLPRFVLLNSLQPLIMKHFAQGTTWHPVLGSVLGLCVITLGALTVIPRWGLLGVMLTTAAGVLPGWIYLGLREWRAFQTCRY